MRWILVLLIIIVAVVIVQNQRNSCEWFQTAWVDCLTGKTAGTTPAASTETMPEAEPAAESETQPQ